MPDRLRFHPDVVADLSDAIRSYERISPRLANRFRGAVNAGLDEIESNFKIFPFAFADVRFVRLRRYPCLILFRHTKGVLRVLGVFHNASNPDR